jgi:hypothetical protein
MQDVVTRALAVSIVVAAISGAVGAADSGNQIDITYNESKDLVWANDDGYSSWNVYTGDLQELRETGVYTQSPNWLVERWCNWSAPQFHYNDVPAPDRCGFQLVSGNRAQIEGGLGTDSGGNTRLNTRSCHPDDTPPDPPGTPALVTGHCKGLWASWAPSPSADVTSYRVRLGTTPGSPTITRTASSASSFLSALDDGVTYYVSAVAVDATGNPSTASAESFATTTNTTTPSPPASVTATPFPAVNVIDWPPVATNLEQVPEDPASPAIRDLAGYRVYRSTSTDVPLDAAHRIADTSSGSGTPPAIYSDPVAACRYNTYAVTAVDTCGVESPPSPQVDVTAPPSAAPRPPTGLSAFSVLATNMLVWSRPWEDVNGSPIYVDSYRIERTPPTPRTTPIPELRFALLQDVTGGATTFVDASPPAAQPDEAVYYRVRALDDCPNVSDPSSVAEPSCMFSGTVQFQTPIDGAQVAGVAPITVQVSGGTDTYPGVTIRYTHDTLGLTRTHVVSTPGVSWTDFGWLAWPLGGYTIEATVTNSAGCTQTQSVHVTTGDTVACCLDKYPRTLTTVSCASGSIKCKEVTYNIGNERCGTGAVLAAMSVTWIDYSGNQPRWQTTRFNGVAIAKIGDWKTSYDSQTPERGIAEKTNFIASHLTVPYAAPMTSLNTTRVTYVFDKFTDSGSGSLRKVDVFDTNAYTFVLLDAAGNPTDIRTTCDFPSLTVN